MAALSCSDTVPKNLGERVLGKACEDFEEGWEHGLSETTKRLKALNEACRRSSRLVHSPRDRSGTQEELGKLPDHLQSRRVVLPGVLDPAYDRDQVGVQHLGAKKTGATLGTAIDTFIALRVGTAIGGAWMFG